MVGKWHLTKDSDLTEAGAAALVAVPAGLRPLLRHPRRLHEPAPPPPPGEDNHVVEVDQYPDGYYLTDDLTDRCLGMMRRSCGPATPRKPFLTYLAHGAVHAPLHAKAEDIERYRGRYDGGLGRGPRAGASPASRSWASSRPGTELRPPQHRGGRRRPGLGRPRPTTSRRCSPGTWRSTRRWSTASTRRRPAARRRSSRAGRARQHDLRLHVRQRRVPRGRGGRAPPATSSTCSGQPDLEADLRPPRPARRPADHAALPAGLGDGVEHAVPALQDQHPRRRALGARSSLSWPGAGSADAGATARQYAHVTDLLPTLLDLTGVERPDRAPRPARCSRWPAPASPPTLTDAGRTRRPRTEQVYEMAGHRGFYRDGWEVVTRHQPLTPFGDHEWELYDLDRGPDRAAGPGAEHPEQVAELAAGWEEAAPGRTRSIPLDEGSQPEVRPAPGRSLVYGEPVTIRPGTPTLERWRSQLINMRALHDRPPRSTCADGDRGWLVAHGDQGGGYGALRRRRRRLWSLHNDGHGRDAAGSTAGPPGPDGRARPSPADARRAGARWDVTLTVDGEARAADDGLRMLFRDGAVRGHRRRHRPPLTGLVGALRARRPVPVHRDAAPRPLRARRARARLGLALEGHC